MEFLQKVFFSKSEKCENNEVFTLLYRAIFPPQELTHGTKNLLRNSVPLPAFPGEEQ